MKMMMMMIKMKGGAKLQSESGARTKMDLKIFGKRDEVRLLGLLLTRSNKKMKKEKIFIDIISFFFSFSYHPHLLLLHLQTSWKGKKKVKFF